MASRTARKSTRRPAAAVAHRVGELPGAVFFGTLFREERSQFSVTNQHFENLEFARDLQRIRSEYEHDDCQEMLWDDCMEMGFDSKEISRFVANPAAITNGGYYPAPSRTVEHINGR